MREQRFCSALLADDAWSWITNPFPCQLGASFPCCQSPQVIGRVHAMCAKVGDVVSKESIEDGKVFTALITLEVVQYKALELGTSIGSDGV